MGPPCGNRGLTASPPIGRGAKVSRNAQQDRTLVGELSGMTNYSFHKLYTEYHGWIPTSLLTNDMNALIEQ